MLIYYIITIKTDVRKKYCTTNTFRSHKRFQAQSPKEVGKLQSKVTVYTNINWREIEAC